MSILKAKEVIKLVKEYIFEFKKGDIKMVTPDVRQLCLCPFFSVESVNTELNRQTCYSTFSLFNLL